VIAANADRGGSVTRPVAVGRSLAVAVALVALSVGVVSLRVAQAAPGLSYLTDSPVDGVLGLAAGWSLVGVGLETRRRGRRRWFGTLLAVAGIAWFLPEWADPAIGSSLGFTFGLALGWLYPAVVAHALFVVVGPGERRRGDTVILAAGYALFVVALGLLPAFAFDPRAAGCTFCPTNLLNVLGPSPWIDGGTRIAAVATSGWTAFAAVVLARRIALAGRTARRRRALVALPGIAFLTIVGFALARDALVVVPPTDPIDHLLRVGQAVSLTSIAIAVAWEWLRGRQARGRAARLVSELAASPPIGALRGHLATVLGDSDLRLLYPSGAGTVVDAAGRSEELDPPAGRMATPVLRGGTVVAIIEHDADVLQDPGEVDEVVAAARLGLEHERLQAELRAQLDALRLARRRIVELGDAQRKRLERDLHDGAQQHLIALSIGLRLIDRDARTADLLAAASLEVDRALDDLRDVAHGIFPAILDDEGLAAAVEALAEDSAVTMTIRELVDTRCPSSVEIAAYQVVLAAVRSATGPVEVRIRHDPARLIVDVALPSMPDDAVDDVADRIGAVDGTVSLARKDDGTTLSAEIPCGS